MKKKVYITKIMMKKISKMKKNLIIILLPVILKMKNLLKYLLILLPHLKNRFGRQHRGFYNVRSVDVHLDLCVRPPADAALPVVCSHHNLLLADSRRLRYSHAQGEYQAPDKGRGEKNTREKIDI